MINSLRLTQHPKVGATRRLLNFSWPESRGGKPPWGDGWMTENMNKIGFMNGV